MNKVLAGGVLAMVVSICAAPSLSGQGAQAGSATAGGGRAAAEQALVANERAINEAFAKGDVAKVRALLAPDGWSVDSMMGPMATSDVLKQFEQMAKDVKITSWDISDTRTVWVNPNTAILIYKWTGSGTYKGQPIPSPTWASTVWTRRGAKWMAFFHQESLEQKKQ